MTQSWMPGLDAFEARTNGLTTLEIGAYVLLMKHYKRQPGGLPPRGDVLMSIARLTPEEWAECWPNLRPLFERTGDKGEKLAPVGAGGEGKKAKPIDLFAEPTAQGSRLPADWTPDEKEIAHGTSLGFDRAGVLWEAAGFVDYWTAQPGKDGVRTNWPATFRNRLRNAAVRRGLVPAGAGPGGRPPLTGFLAAASRVLARSEDRGS